jgi:cyclic dehypoxanthinyl futalosine synthase
MGTADLSAALEKAFSGERITPREGLLLLAEAPLLELGRAADAARRRKRPDNVVTYIVDRNINYTNVCVARCAFCAFYRKPGDPEGYVLPMEAILEKVRETVELGGTGILLQGGHNPSLPFSFYEEMLRTLRREFPAVHLHAFSPPEVAFFARRFGMDLPEVIGRLKEAGLTDADIARIHAPIGLDIGAVSPAEIAVSIMAEITAQLRLPPREKEQAA